MTSQEREIAEAIKQLRAHLGDTQQDFSNRLGVTVRTVARWESIKPPQGLALNRTVVIAREGGRADLAEILERAARTENALRTSTVAGAIRTLRAALNISQRELAELAGVGPSTIAKAETSFVPHPSVLRKLASIADIEGQKSIADLLTQNAASGEVSRQPRTVLVPEALRRLREERFITQEGLASLLGVGLGRVIEAEEGVPQDTGFLQRVAALCRNLHLRDLEDIFVSAQDPYFLLFPREIRRRKIATEIASFTATASKEDLEVLLRVIHALRERTGKRSPEPA